MMKEEEVDSSGPDENQKTNSTAQHSPTSMSSLYYNLPLVQLPSHQESNHHHDLNRDILSREDIQQQQVSQGTLTPTTTIATTTVTIPAPLGDKHDALLISLPPPPQQAQQTKTTSRTTVACPCNDSIVPPSRGLDRIEMDEQTGHLAPQLKEHQQQQALLTSSSNHNNNKFSRSYSNGSISCCSSSSSKKRERQRRQHHRSWLSQEESKHATNGNNNNNKHNNISHLVHLLLSLFLSSCLALLAAWDAKERCVQHEHDNSVVDQVLLNDDKNYNYMGNSNNNNDGSDAQQQQEQLEGGGTTTTTALACIDMFQHILVPTATITMGLAGLALLWIWKGSSSGAGAGDSSNYNHHEYHHDNARKHSLRLTGQLLLLSLGMAAAQAYQILEVMLRPHVVQNEEQEYDDDNNNNQDRNSNNNNNNPYQSLAAVDRYGHVGDNANLFFLSWISVALALAIFYQLSTAFVRLYTATSSTQQQQQQPGLRNRSRRSRRGRRRERFRLLGSSTTLGTVLSFSSSSSSSWWMVDREKARLRKWYQTATLYRLRFRTGIWVATMVACWVVIASSYHLWKVVLVPNSTAASGGVTQGDVPLWTQVCRTQSSDYQQQQQQQQQNDDNHDNGYDYSYNNNNDDPISSFYYAYTRRTSSNNNNNNFDTKRVSAQVLCQRTVAAGMSGVIATALCATAIGMHLTSRRRASNAKSQQQHITASPSSCSSSNTALEIVAVMTGDSLVGQKNQCHDDDYHDLASYHSNGQTTMTHNNNKHHHDFLLLTHRLPLTTELILSILLSLLLGFNAVFSTGIQGPASTVGNLYFASWLAFFLCVRISLGCVEEAHNLHEEEHEHEQENTEQQQNKNQEGKQQGDEGQQQHSKAQEGAGRTATTVDPVEKNRLNRLRSYFFLCIFSIVCGASAYDAASFSNRRPSEIQAYMMLAPCVVAAISGILFLMCLSKSCYIVLVSKFCFGGLSSIFCFGVWLGDLVLTMHSEDSWAVNKVGEIVVANLYFYSWAGILSAGLLMMSYVKALFQVKHTDYMSLVWMGICKVCFVILGAALHIWHTIADNCEFKEITSGAVTFCSRTVLAIVVSLAGMLVGGLVVFGRLMVALCRTGNGADGLVVNKRSCCCIVGPRTQAHVEMILSLFLVLLFSATVAMVTALGGPGQSVGDLYFSTWLSFIVSLGIFVQCEAQVRKDKPVASSPHHPQPRPASTSTVVTSNNQMMLLTPSPPPNIINGSVLV